MRKKGERMVVRDRERKKEREREKERERDEKWQVKMILILFVFFLVTFYPYSKHVERIRGVRMSCGKYVIGGRGKVIRREKK